MQPFRALTRPMLAPHALLERPRLSPAVTSGPRDRLPRPRAWALHVPCTPDLVITEQLPRPGAGKGILEPLASGARRTGVDCDIAPQWMTAGDMD